MKVLYRQVLIFALTLVVFAIYVATMPPSIHTGDNGEIATAVYTWGIAHPTGFPIYTILAKIFSYILPWLDFAFRLNIFSALIGAVTILIFFFILKKIELSYLASVAASLSLAFAYTFWTHAETIQPYGLTGFFFALVILVFLHWLKTRKEIYFYLLPILSGLGAGTHITFLLVLPFMFIFLFVKDRKLITLRRLFLFVFIFLISFAVIYSYIPFRANKFPAVNWGYASTKESFINYITQREYAEKIGTRSFGSWISMLYEIGRLFIREFAWFGSIGILLGAVNAFRSNRPIFYSGLVVIIFNILLLGNYGNDNNIVLLWRYFLPSYIIMAGFLGIGINIFLNFFWGYKKDTGWKILFAFIIPGLIFVSRFNDLNNHNNFLVQTTMNNILRIIPPKSIFVLSSDTFLGAAQYEQIVLKKRTDLIIIGEGLFDSRQWYREEKKKEMEEKGFRYADNILDIVINNQNTKIYSLLDSDSLKKISNNIYPEGLIIEYGIKNRTLVDPVEIKKLNDQFWQCDLNFLQDKKLDKEVLNKEIVTLYTIALNNVGVYLANNGFIQEGISYIEKSLDIRENKIALYALADVYGALGEKEESWRYKERFDTLKE